MWIAEKPTTQQTNVGVFRVQTNHCTSEISPQVVVTAHWIPHQRNPSRAFGALAPVRLRAPSNPALPPRVSHHSANRTRSVDPRIFRTSASTILVGHLLSFFHVSFVLCTFSVLFTSVCNVFLSKLHVPHQRLFQISFVSLSQ